MAQPQHNLAIETSSRRGFLALGRGDEILEVLELPAKRRHNLDLVPTIDTLCRNHQLKPADLGEVYVSLGPGSFTGLRIAIATAKMLSLSLGVKIVGVSTLDLLCAQHPGSIVGLNVKRDTAWSAAPSAGLEPALRSLDEIRATDLPLIADTLEDAAPAEPDVRVLHRLGRAAAANNEYDDALTLAPAYIREPEAVTLWDERHGPE
ncbi:tRNA (adenosine(37)-N6)-threonylcarbamoyltransferase complex dimerization subunit type 1 TsaB [Algisphaera agarilytica]|uniref:tRNA threonylcarbamoyl adenosine modification protein YeaZ n=1 Tax=Algisphaera agarilytica TaxID=1385975 RepID=A0A7X0H6J7_9BACT|nr:tRNA (adenosine(37)-N6)-threonylcarbamoyltransferase complex dimerization subunit type 1 TsaB [Algisphaera agarilytica]MBB6429982.1 tRNA threonylcarbamoyl adenosine modification protein YeaZ [Algisphaera agarilytica]